MTDLALFDNLPAAYKDLLAQLEPDTTLAGEAFATIKRLSIKGGVFRKVLNSKEVGTIDGRALEAVVVKAAPLSRTFYSGKYVEGEASSPTCWSTDTKTGIPSADVLATDRESNACHDCPQNIKGSGQGESRACRYQQRVAILLVDPDGVVSSSDVYQLSLPATSVFGDDQKKMGMQAYARHLMSHKTPTASVVTEIKFDTSVATPKLMFRPIRPLDEAELGLAIAAQRDPDTAKLVALTVKPKEEQSDVSPSKDAPSNAKVATPPTLFAKEKAEPEEEEVEEPKVKVTKKKSEPAPDEDLASLLDEFDDE